MFKMLYEITFYRATGTRDELCGLGRYGTTVAHTKSMQTVQN
jgi:hypothetical protein